MAMSAFPIYLQQTNKQTNYCQLDKTQLLALEHDVAASLSFRLWFLNQLVSFRQTC